MILSIIYDHFYDTELTFIDILAQNSIHFLRQHFWISALDQ